MPKKKRPRKSEYMQQAYLPNGIERQWSTLAKGWTFKQENDAVGKIQIAIGLEGESSCVKCTFVFEEATVTMGPTGNTQVSHVRRVHIAFNRWIGPLAIYPD